MIKTPSFAADASHRLLGDKQSNPDPNWLLGVLFVDENTDRSFDIFCQTNISSSSDDRNIYAILRRLMIALWVITCNLKCCWITELRSSTIAMLLICFLSLQKGLYSVCLGLEFLGLESMRSVPLWNPPSCLTWLFNWGRPMGFLKSPLLHCEAELGLQFCFRVMGSHWLGSFNSWIFRFLSRLHKSTAPIQKLHVKCPQAAWVLRTNIQLTL